MEDLHIQRGLDHFCQSAPQLPRQSKQRHCSVGRLALHLWDYVRWAHFRRMGPSPMQNLSSDHGGKSLHWRRTCTGIPVPSRRKLPILCAIRQRESALRVSVHVWSPSERRNRFPHQRDSNALQDHPRSALV
eukprot:22006_5